jgi:hypothetical protein
MRKAWIVPAALLPLLAGGCVAKTAFDIVTMPVKATAQAADWATTSQDESDRNYGRKKREEEARAGKAQKQADKEAKRRRDRDDD